MIRDLIYVTSGNDFSIPNTFLKSLSNVKRSRLNFNVLKDFSLLFLNKCFSSTLMTFILFQLHVSFSSFWIVNLSFFISLKIFPNCCQSKILSLDLKKNLRYETSVSCLRMFQNNPRLSSYNGWNIFLHFETREKLPPIRDNLKKSLNLHEQQTIISNDFMKDCIDFKLILEICLKQ